MIYYFFAMKAEAKSFIEKLGLKKNISYRHMDVFENEEYAVCITGTGMIRAAIAVTELLSTRQPSGKDFILNIGICGFRGATSGRKVGETFICNKIISSHDGKTYYPDMIYEIEYEEMQLRTLNKPDENYQYTDEENEELADMEAAGVYEAAIRFINSDQIAFIKIVSDMCDGIFPTKDEVENLVGARANYILEWTHNIATIRKKDDNIRLSEDEIKWIDEISDKMRYSVTRREMLKRRVLYEKITGVYITKKFIEDITI